jgi:predicted RNA binding protein YcfA (HicA-like mRNA interferase family)
VYNSLQARSICGLGNIFDSRVEVPRKIRELKRQLRQAGFSWRPGKGSHTVWTHPALPRVELTMSGSDGDDAKKYQELDVRNVLKKLQEVQEK